MTTLADFLLSFEQAWTPTCNLILLIFLFFLSNTLSLHPGCDLLMKAVPIRQGALAPRAASWILKNTSIDSSHAAQFAAVVRQLLVEGRNPDSQFMLDR